MIFVLGKYLTDLIRVCHAFDKFISICYGDATLLTLVLPQGDQLPPVLGGEGSQVSDSRSWDQHVTHQAAQFEVQLIYRLRPTHLNMNIMD